MEQVAAPVPLTVVVDGAQAIDYLSGADPYGDRVIEGERGAPYPSANQPVAG